MTQDVVGVDLSGFDGGVAVVLGFKDSSGAGVVNAFVAGDLDDGAVGCEVAAHDDEAAGGLEGLVPGVDDGLAGSFDGERGLFGEGLAGDGDAVAFEQAFFEETFGEETAAACVLVVLGCVFAAGREVADEGRVLGDAIEVFHGERDVELARDGDEVKDGVGAAAGGCDGGDRRYRWTGG